MWFEECVVIKKEGFQWQTDLLVQDYNKVRTTEMFKSKERKNLAVAVLSKVDLTLYCEVMKVHKPW